MSLIHYLLEANLYLVAFYLLYVLLLRSETLYQLNRAYLLVTSLLAFIIPMLQLGILKPEIKHMESVSNISLDMSPVSVAVIPAVTVTEAPKWAPVDYAIAIYGAITVIMLALLIFKIAKLIALSKKGNVKRQQGFVVIELPGENIAFSFFGYLFVNPALSKSQTIMHHEEVHIRQKHSWDVIYFELLKIFNWFNPTIYLLEKSMKEVHEFIADQYVATAENSAENYADFLISNAYGVTKNQLTNSFFNKNLLKRRIIMLYQKKSGRAARLKYLLTLPLIGGLLCSSTLAFTSKNYGVVDLAPKHIVTEIEKPVAANRFTPAFPGGTQALYKFLNDNINRSKIENGNIVNHLYMMFSVEKDGSLSNLEIKKSPKGEFKPETVAEITRILNNGPKWVPATRNGEAVSAKSFVLFEFKDGAGFQPKQPATIKTDNGIVFTAVEHSPSFPGGEEALGKFLAKNLVYPKTAKDNNITGKVYVQFIVEPTGLLSNINIVREPGYGLGAEAERVLKLSPKWNPGVQNGKKVRVMFTVPINFSLGQSNKKEAAVSIPNPDSVYTAAEVNPTFPGGEAAFGKFLRDNIRYPKDAKENNVQGRAFTQFIVEKDGSLSNFKSVRDPGTGLGAESIRVLALSPKWLPGRQQGEYVRVQYVVPINFSLANDGAGSVNDLTKYIRDHMRYPRVAKEANIQGQSFVSFSINDQKQIQDIKMLKSPDQSISDEITRVLRNFKTITDAKSGFTYILPVTMAIDHGDGVKQNAEKAPSEISNLYNKSNTIVLGEISVTAYGVVR